MVLTLVTKMVLYKLLSLLHCIYITMVKVLVTTDSWMLSVACQTCQPSILHNFIIFWLHLESNRFVPWIIFCRNYFRVSSFFWWDNIEFLIELNVWRSYQLELSYWSNWRKYKNQHLPSKWCLKACGDSFNSLVYSADYTFQHHDLSLDSQDSLLGFMISRCTHPIKL